MNILAWRRTSWRDLALVGEALALLGFARAATALLSFRAIGWVACRFQSAHSHARIDRSESIARIRWAIGAAARRVPFRAVCFQQGLAAQLMLRRRGVPTTLYFGAAPDEQSGLLAHVWVRDGDVDVVGCDGVTRFAIFAKFPDGKLPADRNDLE